MGFGALMKKHLACLLFFVSCSSGKSGGAGPGSTYPDPRVDPTPTCVSEEGQQPVAEPVFVRNMKGDKSWAETGWFSSPGLVDLNGDGKKDIVVVDTTRVVWFENPTWKLRTIIQGQTKPDNVCIDAHDIDGDGALDLALGADWKPFNTREGGTLQWLRRGPTLDDPWTVFPIDTEPTLHRIRFADLDRLGSAARVREAGLLQVEGRDHLVADGEILFFRFQPGG